MGLKQTFILIYSVWSVLIRPDRINNFKVGKLNKNITDLFFCDFTIGDQWSIISKSEAGFEPADCFHYWLILLLSIWLSVNIINQRPTDTDRLLFWHLMINIFLIDQVNPGFKHNQLFGGNNSRWTLKMNFFIDYWL